MKARLCERRDADQVLELARMFFELSAVYREFASPPGRLEQVLELVLEHGTILVVDRGPRVLGFIALVAVPHPFTGQFYAEELAWFVHPDERAGRAGHQLLRAAEEWTRQRGLSYLKMGAPADEPRVGEHYRRMGYVPVETAWMKRM